MVVERPFATIGRSTSADVPVSSPAAGLKHVYLHLDRRGVFAVDLASRTGTRFDDAPEGARACWLSQGRGLELAGCRVELVEAGPGDGGPGRPPEANPLAEAPGLPPMQLLPEAIPDRPMALLSELSFFGRSRRCAIQAEGEGVARIHGVLVRTPAGAFVVNLAGGGLTVNAEATGPARRLSDGDVLTLGRATFLVRLRPSTDGLAAARPVELGRAAPTTALALPESSALADPTAAGAMRAIREGQQELTRSNDRFQRALVAAVRQMYEEQATLFERHLERLDRLQREIAELRDEIGRRPTPEAATSTRADPRETPDAPPPAPLPAPHPAEPTESGRATSWLLGRLGELEGQLDREVRSGRRDLFSRPGPPPRPRGEA